MSIRRTGDDGYLTFTMEGKEDTMNTTNTLNRLEQMQTELNELWVENFYAPDYEVEA